MGPAGYEISYGRTDRHVHILTRTIPPENTLYLNEGPRPWGGSAVVVNKVASSFTVSLLLPACRQPRRGRNQLLNDMTSIRGSILKTSSSWSNPLPILGHIKSLKLFPNFHTGKEENTTWILNADNCPFTPQGVEEGAISIGSEILTTGLTGCSSPVEVWALPLRLEWLELLAWSCRAEEGCQDYRDNLLLMLYHFHLSPSLSLSLSLCIKCMYLIHFIMSLSSSDFPESDPLLNRIWLTAWLVRSSPTVDAETREFLRSSRNGRNSSGPWGGGDMTWLLLLLWYKVDSSSVMISQL